MQVVIEIPDEYRELFEEEKCKEKFDSLCTNEFGYVLRKAFESGIVLPKCHGDLIDTKDILYNDLECTDGNTYMIVHAPCIDSADVIVPADRG